LADGISSTCPLHRNDLLYAAKNAHEQVMHKLYPFSCNGCTFCFQYICEYIHVYS
jgi:hypothetical protein